MFKKCTCKSINDTTKQIKYNKIMYATDVNKTLNKNCLSISDGPHLN